MSYRLAVPLRPLDVAVIAACLIASLLVGYRFARRARDERAYFLGGNVMPWYVLGISDASGMFDIAGTMWLVSMLFVYGLKSVWIPWLWPVFNQVFLAAYLSSWLRRSDALTGAAWIETRFGRGRGAVLSHLSVVAFALISVVAFLSYAFKGIGKFASDFLPWNLSAEQYALLLIAAPTVYVVKGGMFSVVATELVQFAVLGVSSIVVGLIAIQRVSPELLAQVVPDGWDRLWFGWRLELDWSGSIPAAQSRIAEDGYSLFGLFFMMLLSKGVLVSAAGPAPNYDMQRILSTRSPREAALMNAWVNVVLIFPRYFLVTGLTVLALAFYGDELRRMGNAIDFEMILPYALDRFVPSGLLGLVVAGLLAAFISNFGATVNAAPAYIVNDVYKRFVNPQATPAACVRLSRVASLGVVVCGVGVGFFVESIDAVIKWIVAALWGGYTASNVLKWHWWRFNGYGYFWGMAGGVFAALVLPFAVPGLSALDSFPKVLLLSLAACVTATLLTPPDDERVLKDFYRRVRPWGFWGPILEKLRREEPGLQPNRDFGRDMGNVALGIAWQTSLVVLPIALVIRRLDSAALALLTVAATTWILKLTWYDHLDRREAALQPAAPRASAEAPSSRAAPGRC